jgi:hypothetical protein
MDNYRHMAMNEVYDILLYNSDTVDTKLKKNLIMNLTEYYTFHEEYEKCVNLQKVLKILENNNENNNQTSWW